MIRHNNFVWLDLFKVIDREGSHENLLFVKLNYKNDFYKIKGYIDYVNSHVIIYYHDNVNI